MSDVSYMQLQYWLDSKGLRMEYAQSNTKILLCLTERIPYVTPYYYKKHNGDDAHQNWFDTMHTLDLVVKIK